MFIFLLLERFFNLVYGYEVINILFRISRTIYRVAILRYFEKIIGIGNKIKISNRSILTTHTNRGKNPWSNTILKNSTGGIKLGDGSYFGSNVTLLESVIIGSNTIIGALYLVNKNIPDIVTAFGIPCKVYLNHKS